MNSKEATMGARRGPTLRAQWLGKHLKDFRESAKITLKQAGDYLQRDAATISRLESGIIPARASDVLALLNLYGVDDHKIRDGLEELSRDIWRKGWWDGYAAAPLGVMFDHAWLETRAERIRFYAVMVIPGLFQTRDYAQAVIAAGGMDASSEQIERWVDFRMDRKCVFDAEPAPSLEVILDEAVLHRMIGDSKVMGAQLEHLSEIANRPNVTIRILPFTAGAHASLEGSFSIFDMREPYSDIACVETRSGAVYSEAEGAENFTRAYNSIHSIALNPDESATVIRAAIGRVGRARGRSA
ncbi:helix-turn-helix transcriptional regulator [Streptosporangium sp. NPDC000563]|uniref:helix-turn-helix domain-containing protein n=1 Tax=Streptosporangium sp. NPDC000563 TaxID=3154366 RepID=UPI003323A968